LIVGGGKVAFRKVKNLAVTGADIEVISLNFNRELLEFLQNNEINFKQRSFLQKDLEDKFLIIAATSDKKLNQQIAVQAKQKNILVNVVDNPALSSFTGLASFKQGKLAIAIGTTGTSPALAATIKEKLTCQYGPAYANYLDLLDKLRPLIKDNVSPAERKRLFRKLGDEKIEDYLQNENLEQAIELLLDILPSSIGKEIEEVIADISLQQKGEIDE